MKILIVDDSKTDRCIIKDILEEAGYHTLLTAGTAKETLDLLGITDSSKTDRSVDLILMDIVLPDISGIALCEQIKTVDSLKDIPLIMVTARADDETLRLAFEKGAVDYITKPVNRIELLSRVHSALGLKQETDTRKARERELLEMAEGLCRSNESANKLLNELTSALGHIKVQNEWLESEMSDRKRMEETLRSFEKAVENMQIGVTITDTKGIITYTNPAEAAMHKYKQKELIGRNVSVLTPHKLWKPMTLDLIKKAKSHKRESVNIKKDGTIFPVHLLSDVVLNLKGEPAAIVTTCEDITERKSAEEVLKKNHEELEKRVRERTKELTAANAALKREVAEKLVLQAETVRAAHLASLGELSAGVAHEINNPINGIINCAQILVNRYCRQNKEKDICEMIISEGKRIANIVQALLSFARERSGKKGPVHISRVMADSLALTSAHMRKDGIRFPVDVPDHLPVINGHHQQIQQVFLNLINNAHYALNQKYPKGHENKSLNISAEAVSINKKWVVRVTFLDQGAGIPADILDKVLDPFFSTKPADKGTGLGLSISHGIIADHGGKMSIESREGEYTKVTIDLPAGEKL